MQDIRFYKIFYITISTINFIIHLYNSYHFDAQCVTTSPAKEVIFLSKGDVVEVTLKRQEKLKDQKHTSPIISSPGQKAERKRSTTNSNSEVPQSWSSILGEQNLLYMEAQSRKHSENKETNKNSNAKKVQQNGCNVSIIH